MGKRARSPGSIPRRSWLAVALALAPASCSLFLDTDGLSGAPPGPDGRDAEVDVGSADGASPPTACADGGPQPPECLAQVIPADGLLLWLRADEGVDTTEDGHVRLWRDSTPRLRPGALGADAKQDDEARRPRRVVEAAGPAIVFDASQWLELPPGFDDFTAGVTLLVAYWPQLDNDGWTGPVFALGFPPEQDNCARGCEYSTDALGPSVRCETEVASTSGSIDGRGWAVVAVAHDGVTGAPSCRSRPVTFWRGLDVAGEGSASPLSKAVRTSTRIGRSRYYPQDFFHGKLGELLLYNRKLGDDEIVRVSTYLLARWPRP